MQWKRLFAEDLDRWLKHDSRFVGTAVIADEEHDLFDLMTEDEK